MLCKTIMRSIRQVPRALKSQQLARVKRDRVRASVWRFQSGVITNADVTITNNCCTMNVRSKERAWERVPRGRAPLIEDKENNVQNMSRCMMQSALWSQQHARTYCGFRGSACEFAACQLWFLHASGAAGLKRAALRPRDGLRGTCDTGVPDCRHHARARGKSYIARRCRAKPFAGKLAVRHQRPHLRENR